ncbi:extracellular solute-binding protein [Legionella brunensis]|uniref:Extracellular solute-binding protein n=2 Tax=Legionella brunensis TaxID=29422 RepID=A0A0W0SDW9_9GAMM|nr:extracellular solute-binding protein [Legionella brunensis]
MVILGRLGRILVLLLSTAVTSHASSWIFNNPYPDDDASEKIYYSSFAEQPKTLDPAKSYSSNEYQFISQIYEPILQYDYFIRPYTLVPLIATTMPTVRYLTKFNQIVHDPKDEIAFSVYTVRIKSGIYFQPHPAFAKNKEGEYLYLNLSEDYLNDHDISKLSDFKKTGTRELTVDDYIYQIKRLASPAVNSPIYGLMSEHIVGFRDFAKSLPDNAQQHGFLDLRKYPMAGLRKIDDYTFEITLNSQYSQFMFWLAMPFFAPVPWEADRFYSQPGMDDKNLSFDWYPLGTGPFILSENNPNRRMVLTKNPNFRHDLFPANGSKEDQDAGYLQYAGKPLPLINQAIYTLEKESIPRWNKFLQGYYDLSGISTDSFDQAIQISSIGTPTLTSSMEAKKIRLTQTTDPTIYYLGFNMLDPIVGGRSERARKLRLAISIAVNFDENIAIFYNGRGQAAQGPIPPGIFGYKEGIEGINPYVYRWENGKPKRRSIHEARHLMRAAGYPGGIDPKTGKALILHYDAPLAGGPDDKSLLDWMRKQFARIGIDLNIRATQYNRFQDKMRTGNAQIFSWGWNADYPDPENFLFMLYGANGKVKHNGENAANYENPNYDRLFERMKNRSNDLERQKLIDQMVAMVRHDAPWAWGINTQTLILSQQWVSPTKPNIIGVNGLKYMAIDVAKRNQLREQWNKPVLWPIGLLFLFVVLLVLPLLLAYYRKEQQSAPRVKT